MVATRNIIISVKPEHARNIVAGRKTVELRRRFADISAIGGWMLIYSSSPEKAIVGAAKIEDVRRMGVEPLWNTFSEQVCLSRSAFVDYFRGATEGVGVILGQVAHFDASVPVSELRERFSFFPPQSYRYIHGRLCELLDDARLQIAHRHEHCDRSRGPSPRRRHAH